MLGVNSTLEYLDLQGNPRMGDEGVTALAYGSVRGTLRVMRLGSCVDLPVQELHGKAAPPPEKRLTAGSATGDDGDGDDGGRRSGDGGGGELVPAPDTLAFDDPRFSHLDVVFVAECVYVLPLSPSAPMWTTQAACVCLTTSLVGLALVRAGTPTQP